jgi:hypothetical protein
MAGNPIYSSKQWKEVRRLVLEEDGDCHWCRLHGKRTKATQVDHIVELDRGGDPYDRSNLVPSCASCNSSRGATFVNNKTAQRIQARNKAAQNVSFSAKQSTMALFRDLVRDLEDKFLCKVRWQNGDERINFPDGSSIAVVAASAHAHGMTASVLLVDEIWDISPEVVFTALRPSQIAVKNPMMMMFSTAGDQGSTVLLQLREQGMAAIDSGRTGSLYFAEWSLPPGVSLEDRQYWGWANPALGTTITMKALELAFDSPNRQAFIRGHLNLWVDSTNSYLPINLWNDRKTVDPMPAIQWLVIDSSVDESRYVGIGCAYDGTRVIVTTEFVVESAQQMWAEVVKRMTDPQVKLACTPSLEIHCPPDLRRRMTIVGYAELVKWTGAARAMIVEDRVRHTGDLALSEHFSRAVAVKTGGAIVLSSQKSPGPIELARCSVWGIMLTSRPKASAKPQMAFG